MRAAPLDQDASSQNSALKQSAAPKRVANVKRIAHRSAFTQRELQESTPQSNQNSNQNAGKSRFLVIGCGKEQQGDEAAGHQVAKTVENRQLASVKTLTVSQLSPAHATEIASADYVIFVDACSGQSCSRAVQIEPIVGDFQPLRMLSGKAQGLNPWTLLNLTEQRYGEAPQAWLLKVPAERVDEGSALSTTAQLGCDRATTTIARFLQTY